MLRFFLCLLLLGCGRSHGSGPDVEPFDAGFDSPPPPMGCDAHEFRGCSHASDQWLWNGSECELMHECVGLGFASRRSCLDEYAACGAEDTCGPELELGSNMLEAQIVDDAPYTAEGCLDWPGQSWLARGIFVAPEDGRYSIRGYPYIAWPEENILAIFDGACTAEPRSCHTGEAERWLRAGETITILTTPHYDSDLRDPAPFFYAMDIGVRRIDD